MEKTLLSEGELISSPIGQTVCGLLGESCVFTLGIEAGQRRWRAQPAEARKKGKNVDCYNSRCELR
jgi:hypothetical protein